MSYFEAHNLYKKYDAAQINFSMTAEENTITGIVGRSGSGKSTVLKLISGLTQNDLTPCAENKPAIILDGKDITALAPGKRNIGMVFQTPSLFMNMTVAQNVAYGLICKGESKKTAHAQAEEFLNAFNLQGFGKRKCGGLSGGEAQRVSLARTLITRPKLVLFDEPLSALDAPLRKKLSADIMQWQKDFNFTAIMVTHDINEAKTMCSSIILMDQGNKTWEGKAADFQESLMNL